MNKKRIKYFNDKRTTSIGMCQYTSTDLDLTYGDKSKLIDYSLLTRLICPRYG